MLETDPGVLDEPWLCKFPVFWLIPVLDDHLHLSLLVGDYFVAELPLHQAYQFLLNLLLLGLYFFLQLLVKHRHLTPTVEFGLNRPVDLKNIRDQVEDIKWLVLIRFQGDIEHEVEDSPVDVLDILNGDDLDGLVLEALPSIEQTEHFAEIFGFEVAHADDVFLQLRIFGRFLLAAAPSEILLLQLLHRDVYMPDCLPHRRVKVVF